MLGNYAVDLDASGSWLDFSHTGGAPSYMSIAVGSGRYRYKSGHNAGLTVGERDPPTSSSTT
jgi:hypothetical protein